MQYQAPTNEIMFAMVHSGRMADGLTQGYYSDLSDGAAEAIVAEAGKFAEERLAPLNRQGDVEGARLEDGLVRMPAGWGDAYRGWAAAGWGSIVAKGEYGGQDLPILLNVACTEIWNSANMAFGLNPLLTIGAIEALTAHGSETLKRDYLPKMISGLWTGTMNLTEPAAGSDLSGIRTIAERHPDGSFRLRGQKIFITYGDHDMTDNIVHLVLARLPDAPPGTRGISLFLVPKVLPDGSMNDLRCHSIEHKLGIHASPTCTMVFGDNGGATGWLIGEENKGLACMFTMMNNARLGIGLQGVAIGERAYQQALAFAQERRQGRQGASTEQVPIIMHPDVKRMLLDMRSKTSAARAICYATANALDRAERLTGDEADSARDEAGLLTPVAKAYSTDIGSDVASTGVQIHGGMGFIEETGAAQHMRDARIAAIYEGTNGIHGIDLVTRKLPLRGGHVVRSAIRRFQTIADDLRASNDPLLQRTGQCLDEVIVALARSTEHMLTLLPQAPGDALAGATPYLRLFGIAAGGAYLAEQAGAARQAQISGEDDPMLLRRVTDARFFLEHEGAAALGLERVIFHGPDVINAAYADLAA